MRPPVKQEVMWVSHTFSHLQNAFNTGGWQRSQLCLLLLSIEEVGFPQGSDIEKSGHVLSP